MMPELAKILPSSTVQEIIDELDSQGMAITLQTMYVQYEGEPSECMVTLVAARGELGEKVREIILRLFAALEASGSAERASLEYDIPPDGPVH